MARFLKQSFAQTCLKETDNVNCINLIIEMSPHFLLGRENVPCVAEVVNRSLKADCTDFTNCFLPIDTFRSFSKLHFIEKFYRRFVHFEDTVTYFDTSKLLQAVSGGP